MSLKCDKTPPNSSASSQTQQPHASHECWAGWRIAADRRTAPKRLSEKWLKHLWAARESRLTGQLSRLPRRREQRWACLRLSDYVREASRRAEREEKREKFNFQLPNSMISLIDCTESESGRGNSSSEKSHRNVLHLLEPCSDILRLLFT